MKPVEFKDKNIKVRVLKTFQGSNHGYDSVAYKEGAEVEITQSLYDSVETVQNIGKDKKPLPVEHWVERIKSIKKEDKKETESKR